MFYDSCLALLANMPSSAVGIERVITRLSRLATSPPLRSPLASHNALGQALITANRVQTVHTVFWRTMHSQTLYYVTYLLLPTQSNTHTTTSHTQ